MANGGPLCLFGGGFWSVGGVEKGIERGWGGEKEGGKENTQLVECEWFLSF